MKTLAERARIIIIEISEALIYIKTLKHLKDQEHVMSLLENNLENVYMIYEFDDEYEKK